MKKSFRNANQLECIFTDDSVTFYGPQQEVCFPYGCLDSVKMSFMGILQAASGKTICSFAVDRKDRAEMKDAVKAAQAAMKTADRAEAQVIDLTKKDAKDQVSASLTPEEQLKRYKEQFIQGIISKEEYDARKRQLKP